MGSWEPNKPLKSQCGRADAVSGLEGLEVEGNPMLCPRCRASRLVVINIQLQENDVRLHSCSRCDTRWWLRNGEPVDLPGVLDLATVRKTA